MLGKIAHIALIIMVLSVPTFADETAKETTALPGLGTFENRVLIGSRELKPEQFMPTTTFQGLPLSSNYIYGVFHDEQGEIYISVRELLPYATTGIYVGTRKVGKAGLYADVQTMFKAWRGGVRDIMSDGKRKWISLDKYVAGEASFTLEHDGTNAHWYEAGLLDIKAELRGDGIQWWDPQGNMAYGLNLHRASGTLYGKKVEGWVGIDSQWLEPGQHYSDGPLVAGGKMLLWPAFANEYEDGSWEVGTMMLGFKGFGFIYVVKSNGEVIRGTNVTPEELRQQPNGWPEYARVSFIDDNTGEKRTWEWNAVIGTHMVDHKDIYPNFGLYRGTQGIAQEKGDTRKITYNFGWPDFYVDGRVPRFNELGPIEGWQEYEHKIAE